jgi:hypothetical protein
VGRSCVECSIPDSAVLCHVVLCCAVLCAAVSTDKGFTTVRLGRFKMTRAVNFKVMRPATGCTEDKSWSVSACFPLK